MSRWTADRSILLSILLDDVTGSQEATHIRQDYCRLLDAVLSSKSPLRPFYFTGSKAEGLDLPGSDMDMMNDINNIFCMEVVQSFSEKSDMPGSVYRFYLCTKSDNPCFALLRRVDQLTEIEIPIFRQAIQCIDGVQYLSSNLLMNLVQNIINTPGLNVFKCNKYENRALYRTVG